MAGSHLATPIKLQKFCIRHGIVLAKSYEAKAFGVSTGRAIREAKQRCPDLVVVPPWYGRNIELSQAVRALYIQYTDQVESLA